MYNIEGSAALLLSVCYGVRPDVSLKMTGSNECNRMDQDKLIKKEVEKFFGERYDFMREVFLYYVEFGENVRRTAERFNITKKTVRKYLTQFEEHYLEFKGLIELGKLDYYDHEKLLAFLTRYGRYYVKKQQKINANYKIYLGFLNGDVSLKSLRESTHMSPKTLAEF